jgi:hypothetical protein
MPLGHRQLSDLLVLFEWPQDKPFEQYQFFLGRATIIVLRFLPALSCPGMSAAGES